MWEEEGELLWDSRTVGTTQQQGCPFTQLKKAISLFDKKCLPLPTRHPTTKGSLGRFFPASYQKVVPPTTQHLSKGGPIRNSTNPEKYSTQLLSPCCLAFSSPKERQQGSQVASAEGPHHNKHPGPLALQAWDFLLPPTDTRVRKGERGHQPDIFQFDSHPASSSLCPAQAGNPATSTPTGKPLCPHSLDILSTTQGHQKA